MDHQWNVGKFFAVTLLIAEEEFAPASRTSGSRIPFSISNFNILQFHSRLQDSGENISYWLLHEPGLMSHSGWFHRDSRGTQRRLGNKSDQD